MNALYKFFGVIGLLFVIAGLGVKKRKIQNKFYIIGGIFLTVYSIKIGDIIFILLQIAFIITAIYEEWLA